MTKKNQMHLFLSVLIILFAACKKTETPVEIAQETPVTIIPTPPTAPTSPIIPFYSVGTGSGNLVIDGKSMDFTNIKLVKVKAGSYKTITISNITGSSTQPIVIKNDGLVNISEIMTTENLNYVTISGDNTDGIVYGFNFENIAFRAFRLNGKMNYLTLKSLSFKNVGDYVITAENSTLKYTGSADTRTENFKVLNCLFDNTGTMVFGGALNKDTGEDSGFFKDVEIAFNTFQNTNAGTVCSFSNVQDYLVHDNVVNNINPTNNNHNGVFFMQGNGKFYSNKLTNYQGNSIRMWLYSRGSTPATNEIYNNICYNTRKYGAFELQSFDRNMYSGKTTFANAKVYNNTVGLMNTSKDWDGQILDLYNIGGTLEYYNNLGFSLFTSNTYRGITNMINNMSESIITKEENNKYLLTQAGAVIDLNTFTSVFAGIGATR